MSGPRTVETGTPELLCRVEQGVGVVVLNRPEARNALTLAMKEALLELLPRLEADGAVGCVLVTGAGAAFCAGGDTKTMARDGRLHGQPRGCLRQPARRCQLVARRRRRRPHAGVAARGPLVRSLRRVQGRRLRGGYAGSLALAQPHEGRQGRMIGASAA